MNDLFISMAKDMKISRYNGEGESSYIYRLVLSGIGLWCLNLAMSEKGSQKGLSKNYLTRMLHILMQKYLTIYPPLKECLLSERGDLAKFIRNVYEQTGYLIASGKTSNTLNKSWETIQIAENDNIFLGLPGGDYTINGLGVHCEKAYNVYDLKDFLVRDEMTPEEYVRCLFDELDFFSPDIDTSKFEYFQTCRKLKLSESWKRNFDSKYTVARDTDTGCYYRILVQDGEIRAISENNQEDKKMFTGMDYLRLYAALRKSNRAPMQIELSRLDNEYSRLRILGKLPNREYFFLILNGWPERGFSDRYHFIIKTKLAEPIIKILEDIGFEKKKSGEYYGK
ncbi:MAG: hypothetical protein PUA98_08865 [Selenomonadaceae bacterium]|nr:hypothetical protein [Selenomonadaceae bacterium]